MLQSCALRLLLTCCAATVILMKDDSAQTVCQSKLSDHVGEDKHDMLTNKDLQLGV